MKRLTYLAVATAFLIGVSLSFDACKKEDELYDECLETIKPSVTLKLMISADITYKNNFPYGGVVDFNIRKTYCDGHVSGDYDLSHIKPDDTGLWISGMTYSYHFGNLKDKVAITFHFIDPELGTHWRHEAEISYSDAESNPQSPNITFIRYDIVLPWDI